MRIVKRGRTPSANFWEAYYWMCKNCRSEVQFLPSDKEKITIERSFGDRTIRTYCPVCLGQAEFIETNKPVEVYSPNIIRWEQSF